MGIVNGTTNYILTRMTEEGATYHDALAEAQSLGYAERDPTADVEGYDAGAKAAILATLAFGASVCAGDVYHEGISALTSHRHRLRRPASATASSCSPWPSATPTAAWRCGSTRRWSRPTIPSPRCAESSTPCSSRARRSASSCSTGAAPVAGRPPAPCSATSSTPPPTCAAAPSARVGQLQPARIRPIDDLESAYYLHLEVVGPARRAGPGRHRVRPPRRVDPLDGAGGPGARTPAACSSPTAPARPTSRPRWASCGASTRFARCAASCE